MTIFDAMVRGAMELTPYLALPACLAVCILMAIGHRLWGIGGMRIGAVFGMLFAAAPLVWSGSWYVRRMLAGTLTYPRYGDEWLGLMILGGSATTTLLAGLTLWAMWRWRLNRHSMLRAAR